MYSALDPSVTSANLVIDIRHVLKHV
jgi:hypothetical protein